MGQVQSPTSCVCLDSGPETFTCYTGVDAINACGDGFYCANLAGGFFCGHFVEKCNIFNETDD